MKYARHGIGYAGRLSEAKTAERLGAKLKPASGAMVGAKGDMDYPDFLMEAKSTLATSFKIDETVLAKITGEAENLMKHPALSVTFVNPQGNPRGAGAWVMIPEKLFRELTAPKD